MCRRWVSIGGSGAHEPEEPNDLVARVMAPYVQLPGSRMVRLPPATRQLDAAMGCSSDLDR